MTSDAKIGLLLGLIFIFIIAFIINGLPSFHSQTNNNQLTERMVRSQNAPPGLAARERKVHRQMIRSAGPAEKKPLIEVGRPSGNEQDLRFKAPLPEVTGGGPVKFGANETGGSSNRVGAGRAEVGKTQRTHSQLPRRYVVREGDSLADIAKKFYGPQAGNKKDNVQRIFKANQKSLSSPDKIYCGQELIIPALSSAKADRAGVNGLLVHSILEKVKSVGERHLTVDSGQSAERRVYVVRKGDSLWRIAAEQLGDGQRYKEIAKLNAGKLKNEDELVAGMRLQLPAQ